MRSDGSTLSAVVIQGELEHEEPGGTDIKTMEPGSYFSSRGECAHQVSCERGDDCIIHARMEGRFDVVPVQPENVPVQPEN
ncbi:MAG: DUF4437 domain-containing protein [Myxococcales bacterium]|nr:DUF4437 domain-containing protein [Myxococcales bacterium]